MERITKQETLAVLADEWGNYAARFRRLSPEEQTVFLRKQGYQRLADLLTHVAAWWEVGLQSIERFKVDPQARQLEIDVDPFNAQAVAKVRNATDSEVIRNFEKMRCTFIDHVIALSEDDFQDERIVNQIRMELVNHFEEHKI